MAFQTLAFLGFLALTVLLCHALGRVRPSLGRAALLLGCLYFCWQAGWHAARRVRGRSPSPRAA